LQAVFDKQVIKLHTSLFEDGPSERAKLKTNLNPASSGRAKIGGGWELGFSNLELGRVSK